jgi:hypothetical protein
LYPQQDTRKFYSFVINEYGRFTFGEAIFTRIPRELPPGEVLVVHNYNHFADFHPDDGVEIEMSRCLDPLRYPIGLSLD